MLVLILKEALAAMAVATTRTMMEAVDLAQRRRRVAATMRKAGMRKKRMTSIHRQRRSRRWRSLQMEISRI